MANRLLGVISALPEEFAHLSDQSGPVARNRRPGLLARRDRRPRGGVRRIGRRQGQCRRRHPAAARPLRLPRPDAVRRGGRPRPGAGRGRRRDRHQPHPARLRHATRRLLPHHPARQPAVAGGATGRPAIPRPSRWWRGCARRCRASRWSRCRPRSASGARTPAVHFGTILTGDSFINAEEHAAAPARASSPPRPSRWRAVRWRRSRGAGASDMPFVNVRCLSDLAGPSSHLDFRAFLPIAARYASQVAHRLAPVI